MIGRSGLPDSKTLKLCKLVKNLGKRPGLHKTENDARIGEERFTRFISRLPGRQEIEGRSTDLNF
jgi:hypothetical protein